MPTILITGSAGLLGSACVRYFCDQGFDVVGLDADLRAKFFGAEASIQEVAAGLQSQYGNYTHYSIDLRDRSGLSQIFQQHKGQVCGIVHAAAQPSHDWSAANPIEDFAINAVATLELLEQTRAHCPSATFVFLSTNKVYGDLVNQFDFAEGHSRFELNPDNRFYEFGIDESLSLDQSVHSVFGVSKLAADLLVQEYGRNFGINTAVFRCGCVSGANHRGVSLHGFLSYLLRCNVSRRRYQVFGFGGKQVRDNIHADDVAAAIAAVFEQPRRAEVYNMGGGRDANVSLLEAIAIAESCTGIPMAVDFLPTVRTGDHKWWISDTRKFESHYPSWKRRHDIQSIISELAHSLQGDAQRSSLMLPPG